MNQTLQELELNLYKSLMVSSSFFFLLLSIRDYIQKWVNIMNKKYSKEFIMSTSQKHKQYRTEYNFKRNPYQCYISGWEAQPLHLVNV